MRRLWGDDRTKIAVPRSWSLAEAEHLTAITDFIGWWRANVRRKGGVGGWQSDVTVQRHRVEEAGALGAGPSRGVPTKWRIWWHVRDSIAASLC